MFKSIVKFITAAAIGAMTVTSAAGTPLEAIHNIFDLHFLSSAEIEEIKDASYSCGYEAGSSHSDHSDSLIHTDTADHVHDVPVHKNAVTWATVYFTEYGECYHMDPNCSSLRRSKNIYEISLEDLYNKDTSLRPCKLCVPCDYE